MHNQPDEMYLQLTEIKSGRVFISAAKKSDDGEYVPIAPDSDIKNTLHSFLRRINCEFKFEKDGFSADAADLPKIAENANTYFSGLITKSGKPITIIAPGTKLTLKLIKQNKDLALTLVCLGTEEVLTRRNFIEVPSSYKASDKTMIISLFEEQKARKRNINNEEEGPGIPSYYLMDDKLIELPLYKALIRFIDIEPESQLHRFLVNHATDVLKSHFKLVDFDKFPAPKIQRSTPLVEVVITEDTSSPKLPTLNINQYYIYDQARTSIGHDTPFLISDGKIIARDGEFEKESAKKLFGSEIDQLSIYFAPEALTFLFEKLPTLPSEWKITKKLSYYNISSEKDFDFSLKESGVNGWFDVTFNMPAKLRSSFSKKLMKDILKKKPKYVNAGGRWVQCSKELVESLSLAYFIGSDALKHGTENISPFQVLGLWHFFQRENPQNVPKGIAAAVKKLKSFEVIKKSKFDSHLDAVLRPYQKEGVAWLEFLHEHNLSGVLCDDMGLGKTLQTLAFLWNLKQKNELGQCLIVAPTSAVTNWLMEIEKFLPEFKAVAIEGSNRKEIYKDWDKNELYVASYSIFVRDAEQLSKKGINYIILDEAQFIKNPNAKRTRSLFSVKSRRRLALTGTPLENRLLDLWSIFHFLMPGYFGSLDYFRDTFQFPIEKNANEQALKSLRDKAKPFMLRRLKENVEKDLPAKTETPIFCELTEGQKKVYLHTLSLVKEKVFENINQNGIEKSYIHIFSALTKLRQICNHPGLVLDKPDPTLTSGKFEAFKERLLEAVDEKHTILVFSQFTSMLVYIRKWLEEEKIPFLYLDGATKNRMGLVKDFATGKYPVFLISLKAGGTSLTLTQADYVMHFDPWWNPAVENQATDRAHRIGQDKHVFVYKFYSRGTIEEKILNLQKKKQKLFDDIMSDGLNKPLQLTKSDIEEILTPGF